MALRGSSGPGRFVVPPGLRRVADAWDDQQVALREAASRVAGADAAGFTPGVAGAARSCATAWGALLGRTGALVEDTADGLRATAADLDATDEAVAARLRDHHSTGWWP